MLAQVPRTRWGGIADGNFWPSGYFRVTKGNGIFWLIDPDGGRFLSKGVNSVRFDQDQLRNLSTTIDAVPRVTDVFWNNMFERSPRGARKPSGRSTTATGPPCWDSVCGSSGRAPTRRKC